MFWHNTNINVTHYNTLKVKLSNSQLSKLKYKIKNGTKVTLNLSSNLIGNYNDETNFPNKILFTDAQVWKIRKAFVNGSSANIKFSKTHLSKVIQSSGFLLSPPDIFGPPIPMKSIVNSITNSFEN